MKIKSLTYADPREVGWSVDNLRLKDGINLFVGASGSGKTRVLNILFNLGSFAAGNRFANGQWTLHFEHAGVEYTWRFDGYHFGDDREPRVISEELWVGSPAEVGTSLFSRSEQAFRRGEMDIPKLPVGSTAIYLLREEPSIKPVHEAFSEISRRLFWGEDLQKAVTMHVTPHQIIRKIEKHTMQLPEFAKTEVNLHVTLYVLNKYFPKVFNLVLEQFKQVFPFVTNIQIRSAPEALHLPIAGDIVVALVKERGVTAPIPLHDIASGMQKVLLIITDILISSSHMLYMIDEYENSLGLNAIDFLPSFLADWGGSRQFIITTHHPLLINAIPVSDWFIFNRKGLTIRVLHGEELETRYARSKQQRFTQLINDPLYKEGVQ